MAQTLARHSDVRLTLGVYTHVGIHDQTTAIESLGAPPVLGPRSQLEAPVLQATGTCGRPGHGGTKPHREVPTVVPRGVEIGAIRLASEESQSAPDRTGTPRKRKKNGDPTIAVTLNPNKAIRTFCDQSASLSTGKESRPARVSPTGVEPVTFGSGGHTVLGGELLQAKQVTLVSTNKSASTRCRILQGMSMVCFRFSDAKRDRAGSASPSVTDRRAMARPRPRSANQTLTYSRALLRG